MLYVNHQKTTTYSTAVVPIGSKTFRPDLSPNHELDSLFFCKEFMPKEPVFYAEIKMVEILYEKFGIADSGP